MLDIEEKKIFLDDVITSSEDKDVLKVIKFDDSTDYRFDLVKKHALKKGKEGNAINIISEEERGKFNEKFLKQ